LGISRQNELIFFMKVLLYSNQGLAPLHLGIELETIEQLQEAGHELYIVKCDNQLEGCFFNPCHNLLGCAICEARSDVFYKKIGLRKEWIFKMKNLAKSQNIPLPFFENLQELMAYEYEGVNLGRGVASSIISLKRDSDISSHNQKEFIEFQLRMALNVYLNFDQYIQKFQPDILYFFNGRFAECHPLTGLSKKYNIPFKTMEVSSSKHRFELYNNHLPHSISNRIKNLEIKWDAADPATREEIAAGWIEDRRKGTMKVGISFTQSQKKEQLPKGFDPSKMNIAIFNSSEDEMKVIEEWEHDLYDSQNEVIQKVAAHFKGHPNIHFWLRVHPNLGKVDNEQSRGIELMDFPNMTIIPPFSPVDTYALMQACDKTLSFGSTTGLEATYWGKPSILFGIAFYQSLDCVYNPKSFPALYDLIAQADLAPKPKTNTYKHAFFVATYGRPYRFFKYDGKFNSFYRGEKMKRTYLRTVAYFFKYLYNFKKWFRYNKIVRGKSIWRSDISKLR